MASNEVNTENSNMSGSDDTPNSNSDRKIEINPMILLVRVEHVDGRPIKLEVLKEVTFKDLCTYTNPSHEPHAVEILSSHEIC